MGFFAQLALGGPALGILAGFLAVKALHAMAFDTVAQVATTLFAAYATFVLAEITPVHVSGVLATVALGLCMAAQGRTLVQEHEALHDFWEMVEYLANTIIFVLSGAVIVDKGFNSAYITAADWGWLVALYIILNAIRLTTLGLLFPVLQSFGYGIQRNDVLVMSWAGLRGAVGLVLALFVDEGTEDPRTAARFLFHMAGIAALTLIINGSTTGMLLRYLGMVRRGHSSEVMFVTALHHIEAHTHAREQELRNDVLFASTDWETVHNFLGGIFDELYDELEIVRQRKLLNSAVGAQGSAGCPCSPSNLSLWCRMSRCGCSAGSGQLRKDLGPAQPSPDHGHALEGGLVVSMSDSSSTESSQRHAAEQQGGGASGAAASAETRESASLPGRPESTTTDGGSRSLKASESQPSDTRSTSPDRLGSSSESPEVEAEKSPSTGAGGAAAPTGDAAEKAGRVSTGEYTSARDIDFSALQELVGEELVREARFRFLALLKAEYWALHSSGMISDSAARQLVEAASECQDHVEHELCDFEVISTIVEKGALRRLGACLSATCPAVRNWWQVDTLYFDFELVFGFIEGHRAVHRFFRSIVSRPAVAHKLIEESSSQVVQGRQYLSALEMALPELAGAVKTKHAIRALMHNMVHRAEHLLHHGEIDDKEHASIVQRVHAAWRRARVHACVPSEAQLLQQVGYLNQLDESTFQRLYKASRRQLFSEGDVLVKQGVKSTACFIVVRGTVDIRRRVQVGVVTGDDKAAASRSMGVSKTVDSVGSGAVVGLLPMLTGSAHYITAVATGPVVAVQLAAQDVYKLLRSKPNPDPRVPVRKSSMLESVLCRMAAGVVAESLLAAQLGLQLKSSTVRAMMENARFLRPEPKHPLKLRHRVILLTGAELQPLHEKTALTAVKLKLARKESAFALNTESSTEASADGFDEDYHAKHQHGDDGLPELQDAHFKVLRKAFAFLDVPEDTSQLRWFSRGTRLLVIDPKHADHFSQSAEASVAEKQALAAQAQEAVSALCRQHCTIDPNQVALSMRKLDIASDDKVHRKHTLHVESDGEGRGAEGEGGHPAGVQDMAPSCRIMDKAQFGEGLSFMTPHPDREEAGEA